MLNNIAQYPERLSFNSAIDKVDRMDKLPELDKEDNAMSHNFGMNIYQLSDLLKAIPSDDAEMINYYKHKYNELLDAVICEAMIQSGCSEQAVKRVLEKKGLRCEEYTGLTPLKKARIMTKEDMDEMIKELEEAGFNV